MPDPIETLKQKYPQYAHIENHELARLIVSKYPQYKEPFKHWLVQGQQIDHAKQVAQQVVAKHASQQQPNSAQLIQAQQQRMGIPPGTQTASRSNPNAPGIAQAYQNRNIDPNLIKSLSGPNKPPLGFDPNHTPEQSQSFVDSDVANMPGAKGEMLRGIYGLLDSTPLLAASALLPPIAAGVAADLFTAQMASGLVDAVNDKKKFARDKPAYWTAVAIQGITLGLPHIAPKVWAKIKGEAKAAGVPDSYINEAEHNARQGGHLEPKKVEEVEPNAVPVQSAAPRVSRSKRPKVEVQGVGEGDKEKPTGTRKAKAEEVTLTPTEGPKPGSIPGERPANAETKLPRGPGRSSGKAGADKSATAPVQSNKVQGAKSQAQIDDLSSLTGETKPKPPSPRALFRAAIDHLKAQGHDVHELEGGLALYNDAKTPEEKKMWGLALRDELQKLKSKPPVKAPERPAQAAKPAAGTNVPATEKPASTGDVASNVRVAQGQAFVTVPGGEEMKVDLPANARLRTEAIRDLQAKYDSSKTPTGNVEGKPGGTYKIKTPSGYVGPAVMIKAPVGKTAGVFKLPDGRAIGGVMPMEILSEVSPPPVAPPRSKTRGSWDSGYAEGSPQDRFNRLSARIWNDAKDAGVSTLKDFKEYLAQHYPDKYDDAIKIYTSATDQEIIASRAGLNLKPPSGKSMGERAADINKGLDAKYGKPEELPRLRNPFKKTRGAYTFGHAPDSPAAKFEETVKNVKERIKELNGPVNPEDTSGIVETRVRKLYAIAKNKDETFGQFAARMVELSKTDHSIRITGPTGVPTKADIFDFTDQRGTPRRGYSIEFHPKMETPVKKPTNPQSMSGIFGGPGRSSGRPTPIRTPAIVKAISDYAGDRFIKTKSILHSAAEYLHTGSNASAVARSYAAIHKAHILEGLNPYEQEAVGKFFVSNRPEVADSHPQKLTADGMRILWNNPKIQAAILKAHATQKLIFSMREKQTPSISKSYGFDYTTHGKTTPYGPNQGEDLFMSLVAKKDAAGNPLNERPTGSRAPKNPRTQSPIKRSRFASPATGKAVEYSTDIGEILQHSFSDAVLAETQADFFAHLKANGLGVIQTRTNPKAPNTITYNGVDYPAVPRTYRVSKVGVGLVDKKMWIPSQIAEDYDDMTSGSGSGTYMYKDPSTGVVSERTIGGSDAQKFVMSMQLASPRVITGHALRVLSLATGIRDPNLSPARRAMDTFFSIPTARILPRLTKLYDIANLDMDLPENRQIRLDLAKANALDNSPFAEYMSSGVPGLSWMKEQGHGVLFHEPTGKFNVNDDLKNFGLDVRVKVLNEKIRRAVDGYDVSSPELAAKEAQAMRKHAYAFGEYVSKPSRLIQSLKKMNPYAGTSAPLRATEIKQLMGETGMSGKNLTDSQRKAWRAESYINGIAGSLAGYILLNKLASGHYPWNNKQDNTIELGNGWHLSFGDIDPAASRVMSTLGLSRSARDLQSGNYMDIPKSFAKGVEGGAVDLGVGPGLRMLGTAAGVDIYLIDPNGNAMLAKSYPGAQHPLPSSIYDDDSSGKDTYIKRGRSVLGELSPVADSMLDLFGGASSALSALRSPRSTYSDEEVNPWASLARHVSSADIMFNSPLLQKDKEPKSSGTLSPEQKKYQKQYESVQKVPSYR